MSFWHEAAAAGVANGVAKAGDALLSNQIAYQPVSSISEI
jgi:hypothetical protein